jgi:flagellin-like protein
MGPVQGKTRESETASARKKQRETKKMSAKAKRIERAQRFRRLRRGENRARAVSPVVATLILILIAVAAAAALYLWLVAWQGGVTSGIGSPGAQYTLTIGGSTSAYPFATTAAAWFDANNSDVVVSVNQGGSGAGMAAVCSGQVDIGQASTFYGSGAQPAATPSYIQTNYGCPSTVAVEVVAYDGVDPIVATGNPHGLQSLSWDTLQAIYVAGSTEIPAANTNLHLPGALTMGNDAASQTGAPVLVATPAAAGFAWDQIPACAAATVGDCGNTYAFGVTSVAVQASDVPSGTEVACAAVGFTNDLCDAAATDATTCGWTVCAGGATAAAQEATIVPVSRSDVSGTTQGFIARDLAVGASGGTPLGIGFTGCGGDNQFDGCNMAYTAADTASGNPAVIQLVAGSPNAIGYASDGLAQASNAVVVGGFQGYGQTVVVNIAGESTALAAIAKGIADHESNAATYATDQAYVGWRPFLNVETAPPTGEALRYLQFVMDPANNEAIAAASAEISVYASGLAGHVPVTPIP